MASAVWGASTWWGPPPPAPARPLTDIDFCSGAQLQELTQLIQKLGVQESWSNGPKPGPDLLRAKDFVFSLLGLVHRRDPRFPPTAELLLLHGGIREGSLDLGPAPLGPYARGPHYDAGFTLLVPVFLLDGTGPELQLDLESCYAWIRVPELERGSSVREAWQDCLGPAVPTGRDWIHQTQKEGSLKDPESSADQPHAHFNPIPVGLRVISIPSAKLGHYMDMNVDSRTLDSRMRSCFWQRDLVPQGHTHRCADIGWLPPGSWTSRFCRIRLLASATMVPRKEIPPNRQVPGARWAPPQKRSLLTRACSCLSGPRLPTPPTGPEAEPPAAASSDLWALLTLQLTPASILSPPENSPSLFSTVAVPTSPHSKPRCSIFR